MMGHTPTPWHVDHHVHIKAENGWRVASVNVPSGSVGSWGVNPSDNAHFIVRAVNCHEELLAALEQYASGLTDTGACARAAIAKARGQ